MRLEIVLSRFSEPDLISLYQAGYSIPRMMRDALVSFAHGRPINIIIDDRDRELSIDENTKRVRIAVLIDDNDTVTTGLIRSVRPRFKSAFAKTVLRNAFAVQNISMFFEDRTRTQVDNLLLSEIAGDVNASDYLRHRKKAPVVRKNTGTRHLSSPRVTIPVSAIAAEQGSAAGRPTQNVGARHRIPVQAPAKEVPVLETETQRSVDNTVSSGVVTSPPISTFHISTDTEVVPDTKAISGTPDISTPPDIPATALSSEDKAPDEGIIYIDDNEGMTEDDLLDAFDKL